MIFYSRYTKNSVFAPFIAQNTTMTNIWKLWIGSLQAVYSSTLNSGVIIISAIVENGGIEPKIMTQSQIYKKIWAILGFSLRCLATKSENTCKFVQKVGGNLVTVHIPPNLYSMNTNKALIDQNTYVIFSLKIYDFCHFSTFSKF